MATPVLVSMNATPQRLAEADIALFDTEYWSIIGPHFRLSGRGSFAQMPAVICPVVDLSKVDDDKALQFAISAHTGKSGILDREGLLQKLVTLGAVVSRLSV
jgi:hypothetical protein